LDLAEKELQQTRNDNQALAQYINARRKNEEEVRKKAEEETQKRRRRKPGGRRPWWCPDGPMRVKSSRMSELGESSPPRVVQGLSRLLLAISM
jgi:hypothetical protein